MIMAPGQAPAPPGPAGEPSQNQTMIMTPDQAAAAAITPPSAPAPPPAAAAVAKPNPPAPRSAEKQPAATPRKPTPPAASLPRSGGLPMPMLAGIGVLVLLIIGVVVMLLGRKGDDAGKSAPLATAVPPVGAPATPPASVPADRAPAKPAPAQPEAAKPAPKAEQPAAKPSVMTSPVPMKPVPEKKTPEKKPAEKAKTAPPTHKTPVQTPPAPAPAPVKDEPKAGAMATLIVKATPYAATLTVDGEAKGANQSQFKLTLKPGKHTIKMTHTTGAPFETSVTLDAGDEQTINHDFTGNFGSISVSAGPTWGEIYLDGDPQGKTTPYVIANLRPKEYQVVLVRDGYTVEGGAQFVTVKPGQTANVKFKLKQKK